MSEKTQVTMQISKKEALEHELKRRLFHPPEFARFLLNLAQYLESI